MYGSECGDSIELRSEGFRVQTEYTLLCRATESRTRGKVPESILIQDREVADLQGCQRGGKTVTPECCIFRFFSSFCSFSFCGSFGVAGLRHLWVGLVEEGLVQRLLPAAA